MWGCRVREQEGAEARMTDPASGPPSLSLPHLQKQGARCDRIPVESCRGWGSERSVGRKVSVTCPRAEAEGTGGPALPASAVGDLPVYRVIQMKHVQNFLESTLSRLPLPRVILLF